MQRHFLQTSRFLHVQRLAEDQTQLVPSEGKQFSVYLQPKRGDNNRAAIECACLLIATADAFDVCTRTN